MKKLSSILRLLLTVLLSGWLAVSAEAQLGPEGGVLAKGTFGYNGLIGADVSSPIEYSSNPAVIAVVTDGEMKNYAEVDYGRYNFSQGPAVSTLWVYALKAVGRGAFRIGQYSTLSNSAPTKALGPGINVQFASHIAELAYGDRVGPGLYAGISISSETADTNIKVDGETVASGTTKSSWNYRVGVNWVDKKLSLGAVYAYDGFDSEMSVLGEPTATGRYRQKLLTTGVTYCSSLGTYWTISDQSGYIRGPNVDATTRLWSYGLTQYLSLRLSLNLGYSDRGWSYSGQYRDKEWCFGATLGSNVYRRVGEYLGTADSIYIWAGKQF